MKVKKLLDQLNQLVKDDPKALEKIVYYSDKFDIIQDRCHRRHWNVNLEERFKKNSWFKKKLRFISRVRHLKSSATHGFWEAIKGYEIQIEYKEKLEEISNYKSKLERREIAVLALEKVKLNEKLL